MQIALRMTSRISYFILAQSVVYSLFIFVHFNDILGVLTVGYRIVREPGNDEARSAVFDPDKIVPVENHGKFRMPTSLSLKVA